MSGNEKKYIDKVFYTYDIDYKNYNLNSFEECLENYLGNSSLSAF